MNRRRLVSALAVVCAATLALAAPAPAAVYVPTKTSDGADGACDADCSLREAVLAANAHDGEDVILLHVGTYVLSIGGNDDDGAGGDLDLTGDLVILGDGAPRTIVDGGAIDRIFQVPAGVEVELDDLTLRNGLAAGDGGAIHNAGELAIRRCLLAGNRSAAGPAGAGSGGAVFTDGASSKLTIGESTLADNRSAKAGGAILVGGTMSLTNVTLHGNRAEGDSGGGLYVRASARATVNNATISENVAALGGGGVFAEQSAFIGIAPKITNSILAANTAGSSPDCAGDIDSGYDLVGVLTGCHGPSTSKHDLFGTITPTNPVLEGLGNAGGPTPTLPLHVGDGHPTNPSSPAIGNGSPAAPGSGGDACAATDQRGAKRPAGGPCDIGAFEVSNACVPGGPSLCLSSGRFRVAARFDTNSGSGQAQATSLTGESGYFSFFGPSNVEVTVKLTNGCAANNRYWFFASGMTRGGVVLTVTDTKTGATKVYSNPKGRIFRSVLDTGAFDTCPRRYSSAPTGSSSRAASSISSAVGSRRCPVRRRSRPIARSFHSSRIS